MASKQIVNQRGEIVIPDPPLARFLFSSTRLAWLWLLVRVYLGFVWLTSGYNKISGGTWNNGEQLKGFWTAAVQPTGEGATNIAFAWYRGFIQFMLDAGWYTWFAPLIAWGEILIGVALILGALTGLAAFGGAFLNWNFIMAGSASTNGMLLVLALLLMMAWKVAGWWGLDRWLLPWLGTPWYRIAPPVPAKQASG